MDGGGGGRGGGGGGWWKGAMKEEAGGHPVICIFTQTQPQMLVRGVTQLAVDASVLNLAPDRLLLLNLAPDMLLILPLVPDRPSLRSPVRAAINSCHSGL